MAGSFGGTSSIGPPIATAADAAATWASTSSVGASTTTGASTNSARLAATSDVAASTVVGSSGSRSRATSGSGGAEVVGLDVPVGGGAVGVHAVAPQPSAETTRAAASTRRADSRITR